MTGRLEKAVEISTRLRLNAERVMVMKNRLEACWKCGAKPTKRSALGVGSSDLILVVPPHGRFLGIEMKREKGGRVSEEQALWIECVRSFNGVAGVASNEEEALKLLAEARLLP